MLFIEAFDNYFRGCQQKIVDYWQECGYTHQQPTLTYQAGKRYVKIIKHYAGGSQSVFGFVDQTNGDILRAATWRAPAKHARGNVFDTDFGLSRTRWTGPEYLR